ncbi:MAG: translation initiation factor IF-3 [Thermodesulfobacteriota bacterium]
MKKPSGDRSERRGEARARINEEIDCKEVRLIDEEGAQVGIVSVAVARARAEAAGLDLVELSASADPPVCRVMDFGKYRYEQSKKQQEAKKKQTVIEVKEIKLRPKTEKHDLEFKLKNIKKFLQQKNKVKITLRFRGREIVYADTIGMEMLNKLCEELAADAVILQPPKMEGRQLSMFVGPK